MRTLYRLFTTLIKSQKLKLLLVFKMLQLLLLLLLYLHVGAAQKHVTCTSQLGSCSCGTDQGVIDLSPLDGRGKAQFRDVDGGSETDHVYSYNPCSGLTAGNCTNVAMCQRFKGKSMFWNLGTQASAKFVTDETRGLEIVYSQVYPNKPVLMRTAHVQLRCEPEVEKIFVVNGEDLDNTGNFYFVLISKYACPGGSKPTTSARPVTPDGPVMSDRPSSGGGDNVQVNVLVNTGIIDRSHSSSLLAVGAGLLMLLITFTVYLSCRARRTLYTQRDLEKLKKENRGHFHI